MMDGRAEQLRRFVLAGMRKPFVWGACDCCLWVCDWIAQVRSIDPAASLRGTYDSREACAALLEREGGLPALAARLAQTAGMTITSTPGAGDAAIVETRIGPALMIVTAEDAYAWKSPGGVLYARSVPPLAAWSV